MKKILSVFVALILAHFALAQSSFMYEISGGKFKKKSYLFGTIHMQQESLFNWNNKVYEAIDQCDIAAFEINMQGGVDLKKAINPKMQKEWTNFFISEFLPELERSIPADTLASKITRFFKPLMESMMGASNKEVKRADFVDAYLQNYAVKKGKHIEGIETIAEQVNLINSIDKKQMLASIMKFLKSDDWSAGMSSMMLEQGQMMEYYRDKDFDGVCNFLQSSFNSTEYQMFSEFYKQVFEVRNQIMYDRIIKSMKKKSVFMAVGSGHLCGSTGLVEKFRKAGYTVTPIDIKTTTPANQMVWRTYSQPEFEVEIPSDVDSVFDDSEDAWLREYSTSLVNTTFTSLGKAKFNITKYYEPNDSETIEETWNYEMVDTMVVDDEMEVTEETVTTDEEVIEYDSPIEAPKSYFEKVRDGLKSELFVSMVSSMKGAKMNDSRDTIYVGEGENMKMIIKTTSFGSNELNYTILPTYDDASINYGWNLQVIGDPAILDSKEILRFFTSFKMKP